MEQDTKDVSCLCNMSYFECIILQQFQAKQNSHFMLSEIDIHNIYVIKPYNVSLS